MAKLSWEQIKNLRPSDAVPVTEVPDVQMVRVGGTDKHPKLGGINRTIRRGNGRRGAGYRRVFQPAKSPKPGTVLDPRSRMSKLNKAARQYAILNQLQQAAAAQAAREAAAADADFMARAI